jgi:hypothetical protein
VVALTTYVGVVGGQAIGGWNDGGRGREREREMAETEGRGWFFANFGSNFLHDQAMKSTHIYRKLKRIILSTQGKITTFDLVGRILTVGSK